MQASLNCLYRAVSKYSQTDELDQLYEIMLLFSEFGEVPTSELGHIYKNYKLLEEDGLFFRSLEGLGQFCFDVCTHTESPEVFLMSVDDYNSNIDTCTDNRSIRELFRRYGSVIENTQVNKKKSNIFTKLFN